MLLSELIFEIYFHIFCPGTSNTASQSPGPKHFSSLLEGIGILVILVRVFQSVVDRFLVGEASGHSGVP